MLVLAMQFSRGDGGRTAATSARPERAEAAQRARPGARRQLERALPQNGTEDGTSPMSSDREDESYDRWHARRPTSQCINWECPTGSTNADESNGLLRKEVIQPHLPVRLPCYDFTPIADPTFDSSLPDGLGHWLRVLPTFVV